MKTLVCLLMLIGAFHFSKAMTKEERMLTFQKLADQCTSNEGATDDDLAEIMERKMPSTRTGKCLSACIGEAIGVMKYNQVDIERTVEVAKFVFDGDDAKVQMARDLANDCAGITDDDRCEAAVKIFECGHSAVKKRGITFEDV